MAELMLTQSELVAMDYGQKQDYLLQIGQEMLDLKEEFVRVSGRYAEIKAHLDLLKNLKQVIQSDLKATQASGGGTAF